MFEPVSSEHGFLKTVISAPSPLRSLTDTDNRACFHSVGKSRVPNRIFRKRFSYLQTLQAGTVAFCGVGAATMAHNGGKHEWDITAAQAKEAAYVSSKAFQGRNEEKKTVAD